MEKLKTGRNLMWAVVMQTRRFMYKLVRAIIHLHGGPPLQITSANNSTFHTKFINHTSGLNNWNNWNLAVTTDANRGGTGYAEYFVIRARCLGWGNGDYSAAI